MMTLGSSMSPPQLAEQRRSPMPLLARHAGADPTAVAQGAGLQLLSAAAAEQRLGPLPLLACLAGAGISAVADDAGLQHVHAEAR